MWTRRFRFSWLRRNVPTSLFILLFFVLFSEGRHRHQHHNTFVMDNEDPESGPWEDWSRTSECSRSCGGGVATQTRRCQDETEDGSHSCHGPSRRYFSCNVQDCPDGSKDFRAEQCSSFDAVHFEGRYYEWIPYTKAPNLCELNCMPRGERFYYRHKRKVTDGTRCDEENHNICVDGKCIPVGCDMLLGSNAREDKCRECGGDGSNCNTISGTFDLNNLQVGYNDILLVPAGATNILIREVRASNNYLAIRNVSSHFYLNGNWRIDFPRELTFAGTIFHYERKPHTFFAPENVRALGPITEALYIVVLYQESNPGIYYEYSLPRGIVQTETSNYTWIPSDFSQCSAQCGGGYQTRRVVCARTSDYGEVESHLCDRAAMPNMDQPCNENPCPIRWDVGEWERCDCTQNGTQFRQVFCEQTVSGARAVVDDSRCIEELGPRPARTQECGKESCPTWFIGKWLPCDKLCGDGEQSRVVKCHSKKEGKVTLYEDEECPKPKPEEKQSCMLHPCEGADWITSPWSKSEEICGLTKETRSILCATKAGKMSSDCHEYREPNSTRDCKSKACEFAWLAVQWSDCSAKCGAGFRTRHVFCGQTKDEGVTTVPDDKCDESKKYSMEETCVGIDCTGEWFTGPWSKCSKECGGGSRSRVVLCIVGNETTTDAKNCREDLIEYTNEDCNQEACGTDELITVEETTVMEDEEECEEDPEEEVTSGYGSGSGGSGMEQFDDLTTDSGSGDPFDSSTMGMSSGDPTIESSTMMDFSTTNMASSGVPITSGDGSGESFTTESSSGSGSGSDFIDISSAESDPKTAKDEGDYPPEDNIPEVQGRRKRQAETEDATMLDGLIESGSGSGSGSGMGSGSGSGLEMGSGSGSVMETGTDRMIESSGSGSGDAQILPIDEMSGSGSGMSSGMGDDYSSVISGSGSGSGLGPSTESMSGSGSGSGMEPGSGEDASGSGWLGSGSGKSSTFGFSTASTLEDISEEMTTKKCKPRTRKPAVDCSTAPFGCCPNMKDVSLGPFAAGCPSPRTCNDTKFGCCSDGVSIAKGKNNKGCPKVDCKETLYGCCPDGVRVATGNENAGCGCNVTEYGCCPDEITPAKGKKNKGCPEKVINCQDTKFGCCPESKIAAKGENYKDCKEINLKNCTASFFGCCHDGKTSALGRNMEGCPAACMSESFGCCDDGLTAAHGPNREGCCLNTQFGCCADNILPARGYFNEGCGCEFSIYGCCPDNVTAARGPDGCGCRFTEHGCCPDGVTEAKGSNFEECPCQTFKFGCCPDGVTIAKGTSKEGCGCQYSEFGCCPDRRTNAEGTNNEGCGCESSYHGCCPDGTTSARGEEFEGCEDIPVKPGDICGLDKERGSCRNFTVKWFFDMEYGGCSRFWWGGCEGNGNKFPTQDECKAVCVEPEGRDACYLPKVPGPCEGYYPSWHYDPAREVCQQFIYGGCLGNNNRFSTREQCENVCLLPDRVDACDQPKTEGPCRGNFTRWSFDKESGTCSEFQFGGCKSNNNNFLTEKECHQRCKEEGRARAKLDQCSGERNEGHGGANLQRWHFDTDKAACIPFFYGGYGGNSNRFVSRTECQVVCLSKNVCFLPKTHGHCGEKLARWHYDSSEQRCMPFYYSNCGGNANRFSTLEDCEKTCPAALLAENTCIQPQAVGDCAHYTERYFYDAYESKCKAFVYSGCGGNTNNFMIIDDCRNKCERTYAPQPHPGEFNIGHCFADTNQGSCSGTENQINWHYDHQVGVCKQFRYTGCETMNRFENKQDCEDKCGQSQDICFLPQVPGPCSGAFNQWHYDAESDSCTHFEYSGCEGNGNRFDTQTQCEQRCKKSRGETETTVVETTTFRYDPNDLCTFPMEPGPCRGMIPAFFFDPSASRCKLFTFGGCGGNDNRFTSEELCERQCIYRTQDVCGLPPDIGPCRGRIEKYFFDGRTCRQFNYGGCQGNGNRFSTLEECASICPHEDALTEQDGDNQICDCENKCQYGHKPSRDCSCECRDPCSEQRCPQGSQCSVEFYGGHPRPVCRRVSKPGTCPTPRPTATNCEQNCQSDMDCQAELKCCFNGCGSSCLAPAEHQSHHSPGYSAPEIVGGETEVAAEEGSLASLECLARGQPEPQISWRKGEEKISGDSGRFRMLGDGTLQIIGLYESDAGRYTCTAENGVGRAVEHEVTLTVTEPTSAAADVVDSEPNLIVTLGTSANLRCFAVGWPRPSVTWWREDRMLPIVSVRYEQLRDSSLAIRLVALRDLGPYTCQAYNGMGKAASWTVTLQAVGPVDNINPEDEEFRQYIVEKPRERTTIRPRPAPETTTELTTTTMRRRPDDHDPLIPSYIVPLRTNIAMERTVFPVGSELSVPCEVEGYPHPTVTWRRDEVEVPSDDRMRVLEDYTLIVENASTSDSGMYRCDAVNEYGVATSAVTLVVEGVYLHPNCTDNPFFANCKLIVKASYCTNKYYARFCCKSCTLAGQLQPFGPHLHEYGTGYFRRPPTEFNSQQT